MEELKLYLAMPSLKQFGGIKVTKESKLEEEIDGKVKQTLENLVLTTTVNDEREFEGRKIKESSTVETTLKEGDILVYVEGQGYILPTTKMTTLEGLREEIDCVVDAIGGEENEKENV